MTKKNLKQKTTKNGEIIFIRFLLIILGLLLLLMGLYFYILLPFAVLVFYFAFKKDSKKPVKIIEETTNETIKEEKETPYIYLRFKVAGVTFKNGRKARQAILRAFKWGDEILKTVNFEPYEYEGKPAIYVKLNDQIIGNIPSDATEKFLEYEKVYKRDNVHCDVYGGSKLDDGTRTNYGCEIIVRYLKEEL